MPYLIVDNFSGGLDSRRHVLNSKDGTLAVLKNAHITRGGEIEKRKAFTQFAALPAGTFGLETTVDKIYVFGSNTTPTMPAGVTYQRLQHPDGLAMTKVVWSTVYGGLPFVIAEYADGRRFSFWDGAIIRDSFVGIASAAMGSLDDFAEHLLQDFNFDSYTCARTGSTLTITSPIGKPFDIAASITSPMTATVTRTQEAKVPVQGKTAYGSFTISGGSEDPAQVTSGSMLLVGPGLPDITGVYVNGIDILSLSPGSGIQWDSIPGDSGWLSGRRLCKTISTYINANSLNSKFTSIFIQAAIGAGQFKIIADSALGSSANGWDVKIEFLTNPTGTDYLGELIDGSPIASPHNAGRFIAELSGAGVLSGGSDNGITSVTVDGVEIMGQTVPWKISNSSTAQDIVDAIEAYTSIPEYLTEAENGVVTINALAGTGSAPNKKVVSVQTQGDVAVSAVIAMANGTADFAGTTQISTVELGGTFTVGGKASVTITDPDVTDSYIFGASRIAGTNQNFSITYKGKEYMAEKSTMYFSALNDATKWDIYDTGSGFIDMSNNFGGREDLTGFGIYQGSLAVFSRRNVQLWFLDADPAQNQQQQILSNTGCLAPDSVISMGAIDLLYLADNGVRSLKAREGTDTAFASDIGSAIDSIVISHMSTLTESQKDLAKAVVEPVDGRYWLALGNKLFVLSYFPGSSISAWSTYETGFTIDEVAVQAPKLYVRSGNTIYLYGGPNGSSYDSAEVVVEMPYLDAKKPATYKRAKGIDMTVEGQWQIHIGFDHTNPTARDLIATVNQPTFALGKIDAVGLGTHFGVRLVNSASGYAKLANVIVHYDELQPKHAAGQG